MQGFNMGRYVPPDLEGTTSGNALHKKRAPGTLRKDGTQTVRFEMPFAVICHTCQPLQIIGQGVRFNAVKTRVGQYFSTPIWSFALKHVACGGPIEIRTDPRNTAYVVVKGGKARDYGDGGDEVLREGEGGVPILTVEERERRRGDAFARLEGEVVEKVDVEGNARRIKELYREKERDWEDPWEANRRMRSSARRERKVRKREEEADEALKARLGTDMELLPGTEEDAQRAKLVTFGGACDNSTPSHTRHKAFFETRSASRPVTALSKVAKESRKEALRRELVDNTRAALNPFGDD
ncbi:Protein saf4 [Friedmanniomyces endolithicus]|nr:Protein saf4 [Friedmanniomyces endolithicus]